MNYDWGYMRRRIEAMEREQSLLGKRIDELEARLRAENDGPIPGDIGLDVDEFVLKYGPGYDTELGAYRMQPPEQDDDPR